MDVPRNSAEEAVDQEDALLGVIKLPLPTDPDTLQHLDSITEDEDITPVDELNENYHIDVKAVGTDFSWNRPFDHIGYDGGMGHQDADRVDFEIKKKSMN